MNNVSGIYRIKNIVTGRVYIGSSKNCMTRISQHKMLLNNKKHHNDDMIDEWERFGEKSFRFDILEMCSEKDLRKQELFWCIKYDSMNSLNGFNKRRSFKKESISSGEEQPNLLVSKNFTKVLSDGDLKVFFLLASKMEWNNLLVLLPSDKKAFASSINIRVNTFSTVIKSLISKGVMRKIDGCEYAFNYNFVRWGTYEKLSTSEIVNVVTGNQRYHCQL